MTKLETITAEDLQNRTYEPAHFLVDELISERLPLRNAQAKPQGQPRLADFRRTREDMQAFWDEFIHQKMCWFICPVLQIFRIDSV